jgi:hypothetical protein
MQPIPLEKPGCRLENNIKTDLKDLGRKVMEWIDLAQGQGLMEGPREGPDGSAAAWNAGNLQTMRTIGARVAVAGYGRDPKNSTEIGCDRRFGVHNCN